MSDAKVFLVLTALGTDRPGIVEQVSQFIFKHQGNIEESQMTVLGGEFALMMLISGSEQAAAAIERESTDFVQRLGLSALTKRTAAPAGPDAHTGLLYRLHASCLDHPGIVSRVSQVLAAQGVNIEKVQCSARPGSMSGSPVFDMEMIVAIPLEGLVLPLRDALEQLSADEGIDLEFEKAN